MNKIFIVSDLHFGHENILKHENRPFKTIEEMDSYIINYWNTLIDVYDTVYILGDLSWYKKDKTEEILKQLHGEKILVIGNHDNRFLKNTNFDRSLFVEIVNYKEVLYNNKRITMSHFPMIDWNGKFHGAYHLYGHVHTVKNPDIEYMENVKNSYNICWDYNNGILELDEILNRIENKNIGR